MAKADLAAVAGVNIFRAEHPRKLIIRNLPRIQSVSDMEVRRAELERAFRKYGSDRGVIVVVPLNRSFAFVEMESERETVCFVGVVLIRRALACASTANVSHTFLFIYRIEP
jgi:hypothetical protein